MLVNPLSRKKLSWWTEMDLAQISKTLADLKTLRSAIDPAIQNLERVYDTLYALSISDISTFADAGAVKSRSFPSNGHHRRVLHLDNAIKVLQEAGKDMHINEIAEQIARVTGKRTTRASVDGALSRHIREFKDNSDIVRVSAGVFGLRPRPNPSE
jgi:hypothetical protein